MINSAPAVVFFPNNVPCGPRSICRLSKSKKFDSSWPARLRYTPSTKTPTEPSKARLLPTVPIPRISRLAVACALLVLWKPTLGVTAEIFERLSMCWAASASPLIAVTATGVFCKLSVRRCAVTMISATLPLSEAGAAKESVDWPLAAGATRADKNTVAAPSADRDVPTLEVGGRHRWVLDLSFIVSTCPPRSSPENARTHVR